MEMEPAIWLLTGATIVAIMLLIVAYSAKKAVKQENTKHIRIRVHMIGSQSYMFEDASPYIGVQVLDYAGTDIIEDSRAERARIKRELLENVEIGKTYDATFTRVPCGWRITELAEVKYNSEVSIP